MKTMKRRIAFSLLCICSFMMAAELEIDGAFKKLDKDGAPAEWVLHTWEGYLPLANLTVLRGADNGANALRLDNAKAQFGAVFRTAHRQKGLSGDSIQLTFRARGRGDCNVCLYFYTTNGEWNQTTANQSVKLTDKWHNYMVPLTVQDGTAGMSTRFDICLGVPTGGTLEVSSLHAEFTEGSVRGNVNFPKRWTVFAPVPVDYAPRDSELRAIPSNLAGAKAVSLELDSVGTLDFAPLFGGQFLRKCGWAYAVLDSPIECDYTIGAGADWWMQYNLNGTPVIDTLNTGNLKSPYAINNYVQTVRLKKGKNIIAVKLITGTASSVLKLGGPNELRSLNRKLRLSRIQWMETFDGKTVKCTGKPELIKGYPTPGLLSLTGQGVFKTTAAIEAAPSRRVWPIPQEAEQYLALSLRIQNFGRTDKARQDAALSFRFRDGGEDFTVTINHARGDDTLRLTTNADDGARSHNLSYRKLPADFIVAVSATGKYVIAVNSLVDSSTTSFRGKTIFPLNHKYADISLVFAAKSHASAEVTVDNFTVVGATDSTNASGIPFKIERAKSFDPVKAGWKLAFEDNFDGNSLNPAKWFFSDSSNKERLAIKDGKCVITADWKDAKKEKITSASIYTQQEFVYGYFEARVKFRKEHGWWSAFWLCTYSGCSNPFYDGFEIDIYEDYYLRSAEPGGKPRDILDHNLHIFSGGVLKSWNYNSHLTRGLDDFYVIGCKWTPFEISYYLDGKLIASSANHSPYNSVTFDAFNHSAGFTPMRGILSGCCGKSGGDPKFGKFPESFMVDYVRIYAYPDRATPRVSMKVTNNNAFSVKQGTGLHFEVNAAPSPVSKSPIKHVYLFDSGFLLDYKSEPPFSFDVILSKEYLSATDYVKPGRSGKRPNCGSTLHAFAAFAQDADGRVSHSPVITRFVQPYGGNTPWQGKPQIIPGSVKLPYYDEGGPNVAYFDTTDGNSFANRGGIRNNENVDATSSAIGGVAPWEWLRYTVDIKTAGKYTLILNYGTPMFSKNTLLLMLDDGDCCEFPVKRHKADHWGVDTKSTVRNITLPAGKHVLMLLLRGAPLNMSSIDFVLEK